MKNPPIVYTIPAGIALALALVLSLGLSKGLEARVYDGFLGLIPAPLQQKDIVLVNVDDPAVSAVGTWPISRSITADAVLLMKERGVRYTIFDIEYVNKSPRGVDASVLEETYPGQLVEGISRLAENNTALIQAIRQKRISLAEAPAFATQFQEGSMVLQEELVNSLQRIAIDNDSRLARSVEIFGSAFLTINMGTYLDDTISPSLKKTAIEKFSLRRVRGSDLLDNSIEINPVIDPILSQARGIGFTNVTIDPDGVRRRVDLVERYNEAVFPQLAFAPFLDLVGQPSVEIRTDAIVLVGARFPDGKIYDVTIPRAQDGSVLINWPHSLFKDSFRSLSFYYLYMHDQLYSDLVSNLRARATWGYLDQYTGTTPLLEQVLQLKTLREALLSGEAPVEAMNEYRLGREAFLVEMGAYLNAKADEDLMTQLDGVLKQPDLSLDQKTEYEAIQKDLPEWFAKTRGIYENLMEIRNNPEKLGALEGSICFLGNTNTGSTDLGTTPFESNYPNLGTHASVMNMLLQRQFLVDASPWWSWIIGVAGALALTYFLRGRKPVISLSVGAGVSLAAIAIFAVIFIVTGLYLPVIPLAALMIFTFLGTTFFQFLNTEKEKGFLRNAFGRYLSNDVIQQIIANPDQLKLGGQQKQMTAMFTDIKGFSTISEKMTPEELVFLLNQYLTSMSDIILDLQGTIDKYEGDAIIAFFGAPIDFKDHARRACLAAVRMKRVEDELNVRFQEEKLAPLPLLTRIGINTGAMVVGNMGTNRKMDYTIIGDSVNLAARLEGVNKLYGTWILISEDTREAAGDVVETRKLDRVRVVGKSVPIRLYQILEEKGHLPSGMDQLLKSYDVAFEHFEARRWTEAKAGFELCLKIAPEDGPSQLYLKRSIDFEKTPPPANWDGVFKMETK